MGAACCIAAKDRTIISGPSRETLQRHVRNSPSWSFRWDNRGRVAGEETSAYGLHGGGAANGVEVKSSTTVRTAFASEEGSPLDSTRSIEWQKSPISERNLGILKNPSSSDHANSHNTVEVKDSMESPSISFPSPAKQSPSVPSVSSSLSMSPLYYKSHLLSPNSTPSRLHHRSPGHRLSRQVSDSLIPEYKSPACSISEDSLFPASALGNESTRVSHGEASISWSIPASTELMTTRKERWSFDSDASSFNREKISRRNSFDLQTCGICTKLLTERSSWGWSAQKIISTNVLAVVSVLTCGHVYHAECLEYMTSEINKYDPACPVCTFGEKQTVKMSEKALKAKKDSKARKRSKKCVVDGDCSSDIVFDHRKSSGVEGRGLKMSSSISMKSSEGKPFLRRHFSFGAKASGSLSENLSTRRKGLFWAKSSKV